MGLGPRRARRAGRQGWGGGGAHGGAGVTAVTAGRLLAGVDLKQDHTPISYWILASTFLYIHLLKYLKEMLPKRSEVSLRK